MVFETIFEKDYKVADNEMEKTIRNEFGLLENELNNIGHKLRSKPFDTSFCCNTTAEAEYIIAESNPVAVAKLSGYYHSGSTNIAKVTLSIKHFSGKDHKFPEIENIAKSYNLQFLYTGESWSGIANNPHAKN